MTTASTATDLTAVPHWSRIRRRFDDWWHQRGPVLWITAPRADAPPAPVPADLHERWFSPQFRLVAETSRIARTVHAGEAFPLFHCLSAAGDLALYLGGKARVEPNTVWVEPCIAEPPERHPRLTLDRHAPAFLDHTRMVQLAVEQAQGRWLTMLPDLVENLDIVAALRDPQTLLLDLMDRPQWVLRAIDEVTEAYFEVFDHFYGIVRDVHGGNSFCFNLWGPGKTAKVQCDACAMFGPAMFRQFVAPALDRQCQWLDYAMYHLDGEDALPNLEALLEIPCIRAIEWTPRRLSVGDSGGHERHFDLYRRIRAAGKSVQAVGVRPHHVLPLLDTLGPEGMYLMVQAASEDEAMKLEQSVAGYYRS